MKRLLTLLLLVSAMTLSGVAAPIDLKCGKYKGRQLYMGDKGGCYYRVKGKDGKMNRVYVEKENCRGCK